MRGLAAAVASVGSAALFGVGLISPLTPSEGCPSASSLAVFAVVPALVPLATTRFARHSLARAGLIAEAGAIAGLSIWLLHSMRCLQ